MEFKELLGREEEEQAEVKVEENLDNPQASPGVAEEPSK